MEALVENNVKKGKTNAYVQNWITENWGTEESIGNERTLNYYELVPLA